MSASPPPEMGPVEALPGYGPVRERQLAGYLPVDDDAWIYAWFFESQGDPGSDPIVLWLNGGPGSSAVWLQFGAFGPRRIDIPDTLSAPPALARRHIFG